MCNVYEYVCVITCQVELSGEEPSNGHGLVQPFPVPVQGGHLTKLQGVTNTLSAIDGWFNTGLPDLSASDGYGWFYGPQRWWFNRPVSQG